MNLTEDVKKKMYELYLIDSKRINNNSLGISYITYSEDGFFERSDKLNKYYKRATILLREKKLRKICSKLETM